MSDDLSIPNPGFRGNRAGRYGTGPTGRRPRMDPDTRRLLMFACGLGAVLVVLIGASTLMGRHGGEVPVVAADARPIRVKPENPGGMKIDGAENDVFSGGTDTANAKLAPPAETPDAKGMRTAAAEVTPAPSVVSPGVAGPSVVAPSVVAPSVVAPSVVTVGPKPAVVAAAPAARVAPAPPAAKPAAAGHAAVQLAALTSEEAARTEWALMAKRMPELMGGRQPVFSKTERDGHVFWRVRTAGFADVAQARAFCDRVKAKGGGCSVADF